MKRQTFACVLVAAVSLVVAALAHRFCPEFGLTFKPLLWPLAVLPFAVRPSAAVVTAAAVPLLSHSVNGMPTLSRALMLSALALAFAVVVGVARCLVARRRVRPRPCSRALRSAPWEA